jgi:hypothetical protein
MANGQKNTELDEEKMLKEEYAEFRKQQKTKRNLIISGFICGLCTGLLLARLFYYFGLFL